MFCNRQGLSSVNFFVTFAKTCASFEVICDFAGKWTCLTENCLVIRRPFGVFVTARLTCDTEGERQSLLATSGTTLPLVW